MTLGMCSLLTQTFCLMCNTQELWLNNNQIGDKGLEALSASLATGALALGANIYLMINNLTDAGKQAARDATSDSGRKVYL